VNSAHPYSVTISRHGSDHAPSSPAWSIASSTRLDLPHLSEADARPRDRSREWTGMDQACMRGMRRGGGASQRSVGV